jgi:hypothetical protein
MLHAVKTSYQKEFYDCTYGGTVIMLTSEVCMAKVGISNDKEFDHT